LHPSKAFVMRSYRRGGAKRKAPKMPRWTDDMCLVFDLMFALSKINLKPRGPQHDQTYRRKVAGGHRPPEARELIVRSRPPREPHG
jgi:hypothetical protein